VLKFIQDPRNTAVNKEAKTPCPPGVYILGRDISGLHFTVVDLVCALLFSVLCSAILLKLHGFCCFIYLLCFVAGIKLHHHQIL
jgi:hypothetical protein